MLIFAMDKRVVDSAVASAFLLTLLESADRGFPTVAFEDNAGAIQGGKDRYSPEATSLGG